MGLRELFPAEQTRRVLSVSELTGQVKRLLEKQVGQVWVTGEVTNLRAQSSGHIYFTLKDTGAQLACILFRGEAVPQRGQLQDGQKVVLQGELTVYEPRGQYQLRVTAVELQGVGALQIAFERLKQKLAAEGLFDPGRKRSVPRYPERIGLVTSPTGAAIRDVLHVVRRRNPAVEIIFAPCRVQGDGAAEEIAAAVRLLNEFSVAAVAAVCDRRSNAEEDLQRSQTAATNHLALILVTRGGGSLEDLWAFNEEVVARAIFDSALPVVSAVGHEIDFTISDFVADLRAATPSAAAEIITEDVFASREFAADAPESMRQRVRQRLRRKQEDFAQLCQRVARAHPRRGLNEWLQRLDESQIGLRRGAKQVVRECRGAWENLRDRLWRVRPGQLVKQRREILMQERRRLGEQARHRMNDWRGRLQTVQARLQLLGPDQVLSRGYSITMDAESGKVLRDAAEISGGQRLKTRLQVGEVRSRAEAQITPPALNER